MPHQPTSFDLAAHAVAARQSSPLTRADYAGIYRQCSEFLGAGASIDALTTASIRDYLNDLQRRGRAPATIAKHRAALRTLNAAHKRPEAA